MGPRRIWTLERSIGPVAVLVAMVGIGLFGVGAEAGALGWGFLVFKSFILLSSLMHNYTNWSNVSGGEG